jgi:beta-mannosidase
VGVGHPTIRLLADLVHKHSPWIPFLPASPSGPQFVALSDSIGKDRHHDVHGPWKFEPPGHYELFNAEDSLIRTETGAPGHARMEALRHYADGNALWPPATTNPYWTHRGAWWIDYGPMTAFFGEFGEGAAAEGEFAHYLRLQRYLQAEALRYAAEATRRRAPRASGFLVWMGNEPFPNASNTSVIEYDGAPKPAHAALARSFAPVIATARYARMSYEIGERVEAEIAVVEDPGEHAVSGTVSWSLRKMDGGLLGEGAVEFNTNGDGAAQTVGRVGAEATERGVVILRVLTDIKGRQPLVHDYYFVVRESGEPRYAPLRDAPVARVEVRAEVSPAEGRETGSRPSQASRRLRLSNGGDVCALGVFLCGAVGAASISAAPNFLSLFPGESAVVDVTGGNPGWSESNVIVDWINA